MLYSAAIAFQTAAARFSGDSSVNGVMAPARFPVARIVPLLLNVIGVAPIKLTIAPIVAALTVTVTVVLPVAFNAPARPPVVVKVTLVEPIADTTRLS
jgi:hypothetical protein